MKRVYSPKICVGCGKEYIPTSSAQKRCMDCAILYEKKYKIEYRRKYPMNPELSRAYRLMEAYGITIEDYSKMLLAQNGKCAVCGEEVSVIEKIGRMHVDHDHRTGKIRGILCYNCNAALGHLKDSPDFILKLYRYLMGGDI